MTIRNTDRIFLVGPMGAGKSSIGRALALVLTKPFLDLDDEIVKAQGQSIPQIFATEQEQGFRIHETEALLSSVKVKAVIATGGGIVVTPCNHQIMKDNGIVIYLKASVDAQYERTLHDNNRPMIYADDRRQRLQDIFDLRDPLYRKISDVIIDSGENNIHECVEQIKDYLKELSCKQ